MPDTPATPPVPQVQRQIVLPLSKAVEIAYKSIRMRLSRSLLVTSGIVLALAFLMSIQTSDALVRGMRDWINVSKDAEAFLLAQREVAQLEGKLSSLTGALTAATTRPATAPARAFDPVRALGADLETLRRELGPLPADDQGLMAVLSSDRSSVTSMKEWIEARRGLIHASQRLKDQQAKVSDPLAQQVARRLSLLYTQAAGLKTQADPLAKRLADAAEKPPKSAKPIDAREVFGRDLAEIQKEVGILPALHGNLTKAMGADGKLIDVMKQWIELRLRIKGVESELTAARELESTMTANGVPTDPAAVANSRTQTRWLLGLALLVALVGILNAMLMSVTERFREIGTMKCLGALDSFIVKLFLIESLFQGIVGTILGILVGLGLTMVAEWKAYGAHVWTNLPWASVAGAAALVFLVGVALTVAGAVYPAWQAARMQPVEAMRVET